MLIIGVLLLNSELEQQLRNFDFASIADPADNWFAIHESTAAPVEVKFTDPVTQTVVETVTPPAASSLRFKLVPNQDSIDQYLVMGTEASRETGQPQALGSIGADDVISALTSLDYQQVGTVYGTKRLYLPKEGELTEGKMRRWGCEGAGGLPFAIEVRKFYQLSDNDGRGVADYSLQLCTEERSEGGSVSHLASHDGKLHSLTINNEQRRFLIAVVGADHLPQQEEPWSTFFAAEIVSER